VVAACARTAAEPSRVTATAEKKNPLTHDLTLVGATVAAWFCLKKAQINRLVLVDGAAAFPQNLAVCLSRFSAHVAPPLSWLLDHDDRVKRKMQFAGVGFFISLIGCDCCYPNPTIVQLRRGRRIWAPVRYWCTFRFPIVPHVSERSKLASHRRMNAPLQNFVSRQIDIRPVFYDDVVVRQQRCANVS